MANTAPQRPTLKTVALAAGVSPATVSYVLNGRDQVDAKITITPQTRQRVLDAADEVGYSPNQSARGMSRGRTDQICLVVGHLDSPSTHSIVTAVQNTARDLGKTCLLLLDNDWYAFLARQGADAAVIDGETVTHEAQAQLERLAGRGTRIVLLGGPVEPIGVDVLRLQVGPAAREAMGLLASRHTRIGLLRREVGEQSVIAAEYRAVLAASNRYDPALVKDVDDNRAHAYQLAIHLLTLPEPPTALLASNDLSAIAAIHAAHRLGIEIPGQLEIIGFGNTPEALTTDPPLSSMGVDSRPTQLTELLARRLDGDLTGPFVHTRSMQLHRRSTTR